MYEIRFCSAHVPKGVRLRAENLISYIYITLGLDGVWGADGGDG